MHNKVRGMIFEWNFAFGRLSRASFVSKDDVTEENFAVVGVGQCVDQVRLDHREGQHVGRLVLLAILPVERLDFAVRGEAEGDFDCRGRGGEVGVGGRGDGLPRRSFSQDLPIAGGPIVIRKLNKDHASGNAGNGIFANVPISGHQRHARRQRVRHQHPVNRIAVDRRERSSFGG